MRVVYARLAGWRAERTGVWAAKRFEVIRKKQNDMSDMKR